MRKYYLLQLCLLWIGCLSAKAQPPNASIDAQHYGFTLQLNDENNTIKGQAEIKLKFLKDADVFRLDLVKQNEAGKGMLVSSVTENGTSLQFQQDKDAVNISTSAKAES